MHPDAQHAHVVPLLQVAYSPNDEVLASAGYDQAVKVWDCRSRSWEPIQTMRVFADSVTSVTVTNKCAEPLTCPAPLAASMTSACHASPALVAGNLTEVRGQ